MRINRLNTKIVVSNFEIISQSLILFCFYFVEGSLKYFLLTVLLLYFMIIKSSNIFNYIKWHRHTLYLIVPAGFYLIYGTIIGIIKGTTNFITFKFYVFLILPFVLAIYFISQTNDIKRFITLQFVLNIILGGIGFVKAVIKFGLFSESSESSIAFIFALFFLYYFISKNTKCCLISLVFVLLCVKRISLAGIVVAILIYIVSSKVTKSKKLLIRCFFISVIGMVYIYIYGIFSSGLFLLYHKMHIVDMGRERLYKLFSEYIEFNPSFWGNGLGFVMDYLEKKRYPILNLHSDWLLLFVEIGFWGTGIYIYFYYLAVKKIRHNHQVLVLASYLFIVFATDNVMIYINVMYVYYLLILSQNVYTSKIHNSDNKKFMVLKKN